MPWHWRSVPPTTLLHLFLQKFGPFQCLRGRRGTQEYVVDWFAEEDEEARGDKNPMEGDRVAVPEPLLLELGLVETNAKGRVPEVVVLLLLISPYNPLIIARTFRVDLPSWMVPEVLEP